MIGYVLGATRTGNLTLHRVWGSVPGWALCGIWCPVHPHVSTQATGKFCQRCVDLEKSEEGGR
jgi:hypothetical protein